MADKNGRKPTSRRGPLDGVRVIDLSHYGAGPVASMVLGDLGADVIKVEGPGGDPMRRVGVTFPDGWSTFFLAVNRNKRFVSIDYRAPEGRDLIRELVRDADVFMENARPGSYEKYGLGYKELSSLNDRLIYASAPAFGSSGPMRDWLAMDPIAQAVGGLVGVTGSAEGGPARVGTPICDIVTGQLMAFGIVAALYDREHTGNGQLVETSLFASAVSMLSMRDTEYHFTRENPPLLGTAHGQVVPAQAFRTADNRWVMLCCYQDEHWRRWAEASGHDELVLDPRFASAVARAENRAATIAAVAEVMLEKAEHEWTEILAGVVPYGPVMEFDQLFEHPQLDANHLIARFDMPGLGEVRTIGSPVRFSAYELDANRAPAQLGADTRDVLLEAGLTAERVDQLVATGTAITSERE